MAIHCKYSFQLLVTLDSDFALVVGLHRGAISRRFVGEWLRCVA